MTHPEQLGPMLEIQVGYIARIPLFLVLLHAHILLSDLELETQRACSCDRRTAAR